MKHLQGPVVPNKNFTKSEDLSLWSFFMLIDSDYLKWAAEQSDGVSSSLGLVHYAVWTEDWIVDVLSWCEPEVTWIEVKE